jgi:hypothetical protein
MKMETQNEIKQLPQQQQPLTPEEEKLIALLFAALTNIIVEKTIKQT